ncbi:MAG: hypothetical protein RQ985_08000 [Dehalococcoidia bacterium]|jgi:hypothetical protein|nr:hypothetical protein [Dehalococcoidia bacterium]
MTQEVAQAKAVFPSLEWFQILKEMVNHDEGFRRIGTCDTTMGIKITDRQKYYLVTFEAFEVADVREVSEEEAEEADFWLEGPFALWREMLENIKAHGKADHQHTLNTIDLEMPEGFARSHDGLRRDAFYRFNQSLQYFFNASSRIDTVFED